MKVLDHGFVELVDMMGDKHSPARAARVSFSHDGVREWGLVDTERSDAKLSKTLWDNHHGTPFEMIEIMFRVKVPLFIARQWHRHRTFSYNEFSMRYADPARIAEEANGQGEIDFYTPTVWRRQSKTNKQGSSLEPYTDEENARYTKLYHLQVQKSIALYRLMVTEGVALELARIDLPVSTYTTFIVKGNLRNFMHFFELRSTYWDDHAQEEMRAYADAMYDILADHDVLGDLMDIIGPRP